MFRWLAFVLTACSLVACASAPPAPTTPERIVITVIVIVTATPPPVTATATAPPPTTTPRPVTATPRAQRPTTPAPSPTRSAPSPTATRSPAAPAARSATPTRVVISEERNPDGCLKYQFADRYVGQQDCVSGMVVDTYASENAFFINYSDDFTSFYGVSFDLRWENLVGRCVRLRGLIQLYRGRPEIIIREPSQLEFCD